MNILEKKTGFEAGGTDVVTEMGLWIEKKDARWISGERQWAHLIEARTTYLAVLLPESKAHLANFVELRLWCDSPRG